MEQLEFIRNAGETKRFHTWPVLRTQNVAEHSWHVAMLLWFIFGGEEPGVRLQLLMAALTHDAAEWKVGDIPAPAKREMGEQFPNFREKWGKMEQYILAEQQLNWEEFLTEQELQMLKLVDSMDGALYCARERAMGNKLIEPCYDNFISYIEEVLERSFSIPIQHSDRHVGDTVSSHAAAARQVYNHIRDMWEQANAS